MEPDQFLETLPPIYRGQERPARVLATLILDKRIMTPCLTDLYLRVHLMPSSLDPKFFI
jgi:hypothetical protein